MKPVTIKNCTFQNNSGHGIDCVDGKPQRRLEIGSNLYWLLVTCALVAWHIWR